MRRMMTLGLLIVLMSLLISGCAGTAPTNAPAPAPTTVPPTAAPAANTPAAAATPVAAAPTAAAPVGSDSLSATDGLHFVTVAGAGEARYRVREQLANRDLPSDAIGTTKDVSGTLTVSQDGAIVAAQSRFVIGLASLTSDSGRRDGFVANNILQTGRFPNATFVPTAASGLASPLPTSGQGSFELTGDLTVKDVTRPVTWQITITRDGDKLSGTATTSFTFKDFNLTQPRVPVLLSVNDTIKLEFDFQMQLARM